jgi:hypothetical protein
MGTTERRHRPLLLGAASVAAFAAPRPTVSVAVIVLAVTAPTLHRLAV